MSRITLDQQIGLVNAPSCKHSNPIWRTAAILKIARMSITTPWISRFCWHFNW